MCKHCEDTPVVELNAGDFYTDLFCSWACLGEYVEMQED